MKDMNEKNIGGRLPRPQRGSWITLLLGLAILLTGIGVGSAGTAMAMSRRYTDVLSNPERGRREVMHHLIGRLDLPADKKGEVNALIDRHMAELESIRDELRPRYRRQIDLLEEEVAALLDGEREECWRSDMMRVCGTEEDN